MGEWKEVILRDVVSILGDGLHGTPQYDDNGEYYFINGNNLSNGKIIIKEGTKKANKEEYEKYKKDLNDQTIFVSINGTLGNVALYNNEKCILGKSACYFNVLKEVEKHFIKYVVTDKNFQEYIQNFANGTTIKNVSLNIMRDYPFLLPPINEQRAIASILSSLDDKIDLLHRQNKTLEQLAVTLFRQWFVEEADESWEETSISDVAIHIKDSVNPSKNPLEIFYHYSLPAFDDGREPKLEIGSSILSNKYRVPSDCILVSKLNPRVSRIWGLYGKIDELKSICSTEFQIVKPKEKLWYSFIYCFLKSNPITNELAGASGGTSGSHQRVDPKVIFDLAFLKPDAITTKRFNDITSNYWNKIKENKFQIRTLTQLRETLLPKLMSGEVRVKD